MLVLCIVCRLSKALHEQVAAAAALYMQHQAALHNAAAADFSSAAAAATSPLLLTPQLQQLHLSVGSLVTFRLGVSGVDAAAASSSSSLMGLQEQCFELQLPSREAADAGLCGDSTCSSCLLQECLDVLQQQQQQQQLYQEQVQSDNVQGADMQGRFAGLQQQSSWRGLQHFVTPLWASSSSSQQDSSSDITQSTQQQQRQAMPELKGLLLSAARRQQGISQVIGDLLSGLVQQALAVNALGGVTRQGQLQQLPALPQGLPVFSSSSSSSSDNQLPIRAQHQPPAVASNPALWRFGLPPASFSTPSAAAAAMGSSSIGRPPGSLVLLLGPKQSGKSSMLRDAAAALAANGCVSVAAVDTSGKLAAGGMQTE
jgi:hypothetical protein